MHQLIATYLFQHKQCTLLKYGHLFIKTSTAESNFINKQIDAPQQSIHFSNQEIDSAGFIEYVASQKNILLQNAKENVEHFTQLFFSGQQNNLKGIGIFTIQNGSINFEADDVNSLLTQPAYAERVIHQAAEHSMLVGDKETTTTEMTEFLAEKIAPQDKWWIWAILLGLIGISIIVFYYLIDNQY